MGPFRAFLNATLIPRSLFWRSFLIVVVPILVLQIVLTVIFYNRHWDTVTKWLASGVAGEAALLADLVDATPPGTPRDDLLRRFALRTDLDVAFRPGTRLDPDGGGGRRLWHIDQKIVEAFREKLDRPFTIDLNADRPGLATVRVGTGGGVLELRTERRRLTSTTTGLLLAWMLGASAFLIAVAVYFLRIQVRPIRQLARAVESFGMGRDVGDFQLRGPAEIRQAAKAFNTMRGRVLRHIAQRTEMLAAVSHDLRTPLTRMRLELEMLGDDAMADGLKRDTAEMIELVETYLAFVRGEEGEAVEWVPLAPVFAAMRDRVERGGALALDGDGAGLAVPARPLAFRRCLANLVDNACRHGRKVRLAARRSPREVRITVEDDGPGIPPPLRERVFQPFFRADPARRRETGGTGLGLTIARDIALSHGGDIALDTSDLGGLRATLRLPA
ncbi:MAG: HAMP domain-containing protein [Geminicoccaceae bacterium]|nr:HAMP domain-containing protein [Geminicoccaceae bacterium]